MRDFSAVSESADSTRENFLQIFERKMEERNKQLKESGKHLLNALNITTRSSLIYFWVVVCDDSSAVTSEANCCVSFHFDMLF